MLNAFLSSSFLRRHVKQVLQAIFFLLGVGILVPWNAFISAKHYFVSRFCHETGDAPKEALESVFSMVYNLASVTSLGSILAVQYWRDQKRSTENNQHNANGVLRQESVTSDDEESGHSFWLVLVPLSVYFAVFAGQSFLVLHVDLLVHVFWYLTLASLALCGICCSIANAGIVAIAALYDASVSMNPFLAGQSAGGVAVAVANLLTATLEDPSAYWEAHCSGGTSITSQAEACVVYQHRDWAVFSYFFLGTIVLLLCLLSFSLIHRLPSESDYETVQSADEGELRRMYESPASIRGIEMRQPHEPEFDNDLNLSVDSLEMPMVDDVAVDEANETAAVWLKVRGPAFCIFFVFVVTLSLFPGWISELRSAHRCSWKARVFNDLYTPFSFVVFNVGDLTGRVLAAHLPWKRIPRLSRKLVTGSLLRLLFFPLLSMCVGGGERRLTVPSDLFSLVIQFFFALSNGLLVTTAFVHAPRLLPPASHVQERSSELLTFCLAFGLLSGSMLSCPVTNIVSG